jgi:hypothetical protein
VVGSLEIKTQKTAWRVEEQAAVSAGKCTQELFILGGGKKEKSLSEA